MIISSHKITNAPCQGGVETVSNNTQNIMPGFRMLAFKGMQVGCTFLEALPFLQKSYFAKYPNNKYLKHSTKICLNDF